MLVVYLSGLVIVSLVGSWSMRRWKASLQVFGLLEMGVGLLAIGGLFIFNQLANLAMEDVSSQYSIEAEMAFEGVLSTITLLPVTILIGALYPIVSSLYTSEQRQTVGQKVSLLNALNTTGSILGSLLAGFLIIPIFGLQRSIVLLAATNLIIGLSAVWLFDPNSSWALFTLEFYQQIRMHLQPKGNSRCKIKSSRQPFGYSRRPGHNG